MKAMAMQAAHAQAVRLGPFTGKLVLDVLGFRFKVQVEEGKLTVTWLPSTINTER